MHASKFSSRMFRTKALCSCESHWCKYKDYKERVQLLNPNKQIYIHKYFHTVWLFHLHTQMHSVILPPLLTHTQQPPEMLFSLENSRRKTFKKKYFIFSFSVFLPLCHLLHFSFSGFHCIQLFCALAIPQPPLSADHLGDSSYSSSHPVDVDGYLRISSKFTKLRFVFGSISSEF